MVEMHNRGAIQKSLFKHQLGESGGVAALGFHQATRRRTGRVIEMYIGVTV